MSCLSTCRRVEGDFVVFLIGMRINKFEPPGCELDREIHELEDRRARIGSYFGQPGQARFQIADRERDLMLHRAALGSRHLMQRLQQQSLDSRSPFLGRVKVVIVDA